MGGWFRNLGVTGTLAWGEDNADVDLKETLSQVYIFGPLQKRHFLCPFYFFF